MIARLGEARACPITEIRRTDRRSARNQLLTNASPREVRASARQTGIFWFVSHLGYSEPPCRGIHGRRLFFGEDVCPVVFGADSDARKPGILRGFMAFEWRLSEGYTDGAGVCF
jgi:hypothetical protein